LFFHRYYPSHSPIRGASNYEDPFSRDNLKTINMNVEQFIEDLRLQRISLWVDRGQLRYRAPSGVISDDILKKLKLQKALLIEHLQERRPTTMATEASPGNIPLVDEQLSELTPLEQEVASHYDNKRFEFEVDRLSIRPIEQAINSRYLLRYIKSGSEVACVGAGPGYYTELLAHPAAWFTSSTSLNGYLIMPPSGYKKPAYQTKSQVLRWLLPPISPA
jgi:hypothetical protein